MSDEKEKILYRCYVTAEAKRPFGVKLNPNEARKFLKNDQKNPNGLTFFYNNKNFDLLKEIINLEIFYKDMLGQLNSIENGFQDKALKYLGPLLRETWRTYEEDLIIHRYDDSNSRYDKDESEDKNENESEDEDENESEKWGVYTDVLADKKGDSWVLPYHITFHELFHMIYDLSGIAGSEVANLFGEKIEIEANKLLDEEKDPKAKTKRLQDITFRTDNKDKAAIYDIMGAVFHKSKYGCNPSNYKIYNKDGYCDYKYWCKKDKCVENKYHEIRCESCDIKCWDRQWSKVKRVFNKFCKVSIDLDDCNKCKFACKKDDHDNCHVKYKCKKDIKYSCSHRGECSIANVKKNASCSTIFGHFNDYWGEGDFIGKLADESFAHMASEAITNHRSYENIRKYLPESEEIFREILRKISGCREYKSLWVQN